MIYKQQEQYVLRHDPRTYQLKEDFNNGTTQSGSTGNGHGMHRIPGKKPLSFMIDRARICLHMLANPLVYMSTSLNQESRI